jgi:hypothetical protein
MVNVVCSKAFRMLLIFLCSVSFYAESVIMPNAIINLQSVAMQMVIMLSNLMFVCSLEDCHYVMMSAILLGIVLLNGFYA